MSTRSKIIFLLLVLVFAFSSLAVGVITGTQLAAHDMGQFDAAYHPDSLNGAIFTLAGHCDAAPSCSSGSGG